MDNIKIVYSMSLSGKCATREVAMFVSKQLIASVP